jgi:ATP diphosphatase
VPAREAAAHLSEQAHARLSDELGDVLFVICNLARHLKVDPEAALQSANAKFIRRFGYIEGVLAERGQRPEDVSLEMMDALWDEAKRRLG